MLSFGYVGTFRVVVRPAIIPQLFCAYPPPFWARIH